jgi:hypothetical protein
LAGNDIFLPRSALFTNRIKWQGQHQDHGEPGPFLWFRKLFPSHILRLGIFPLLRIHRKRKGLSCAILPLSLLAELLKSQHRDWDLWEI